MSDLVKHASGTMTPAADSVSTALVHRPDSPVIAGAVQTATPAKGGPSRIAVAVIAASILAAVAVGAAAFSGGSGASSAPPGDAAHGSLAASAANTASAHTVAFTVSATETRPGTMTTLLTGSGAADLSKNIGTLTATIPALSSVTGGSGKSLDVISDGSNLYIDAPALSSFTGGKTWLEASVADAASVAGGSAGSAPISMLTNPSEALALLSSLGSKVQRVGSVQLNGVQTTEYRTTISVDAVASKLNHQSQNSKAGKTAAKALQQLGVPTIPVTAWVGNDGLLRQVSVAVDLDHATVGGILGLLDPSAPSNATSNGSAVTLTVGFSDYGQPVSVSVPPASDTTNLNGIFSSVKGGFSKVGSAVSGIINRV